CGRKLGTYLRKRQKMQRESARRDVFERYIGEIAKAINAINGTDAKKLYDTLLAEARKRTAIADVELDEDGKAIKKDEHEDLKNDEGIVMVESRAAHLAEAQAATPAASDTNGSENGNGNGNGHAPEPERVSLGSVKAKKKPAKDDGLFD
ncbi:MAG: hypothetical protein ABSH20_22045, partial [Tepidisphaeraceae bacterium]